MKSEHRAPTRVAPPQKWLLTAGRRGARLLSAEPTAHGRVHVEEQAQIREEWEESQHGRPSPRSGKDSHAYASLGHEDDERTLRFARSVAAWLEHELQARNIDRVHAFTAPRFLGQLRTVLPEPVQEHLQEHALNLEHLAPSDLAVHEAVVHAVLADGPEVGKAPLGGVEALVARTNDRGTANELMLEHAALRGAMRDLRAELERSEKSNAQRVGKLSGMLRMFGHHLRRHFELEERSGYLNRFPDLGPAEQQSVEHLLVEHQKFKEGLVALLDAVERAEDAQAGLSDSFAPALRELLDDIQRHDHAENALVEALATNHPPANN